MNTNKPGIARLVAEAGGLAVAGQLAAPATAFAAGPDILLPKPAEFIPALIAFLIIWFIMAKMAWPMIIETLDARQEKIESDLKAAEDAKAEAEQSAQTYEERIAAEVMRADMLAKAQEESQAIIAKAHDAIDAERAKAMAELSGSVVDLSVEIASKVVGDTLDVEQQRALAIKYLAEVGSLNDD